MLTCVYEKESPEFLSQCIESVKAQKVLPDEWIIVKDGPLTDDLEKVLDSLCFQNETNIISLPENVTLGPARAIGIESAKHEWVAIMDSDDICLPDRFGKQLEMIQNEPELGLIGGQIVEFSDDPDSVVATRNVPTSHGDIIRFAKKRNPFNHMTVMLRRGQAMEAGNYRYFPLFEDYDLWTRMIKNGVMCANHPDILINARVNSMYARRRGMSYIRAEWRLQKQLKAIGMISSAELIRNAAMRFPVRLLPEKALAAVYKRFIR